MAWKARTGQRIETIYAWVATEPDGGEGIVASNFGGGTMYPLIGADTERIESMREEALRIAKLTGFPIKLVEFTARRELESHG